MGQRDLQGPVHTVRCSSFFIGKFEVTNAQYSRFKKRPLTKESPLPNAPVVGLTVKEIKAYLAWLSKKDQRQYSLPTEAQWEYAARGGLRGKDYPWGEEFDSSRGNVGTGRAVDVGSYPPNGYGLYDMAGNVSEYVRESEYDYAATPIIQIDPVGPESGEFHIARGGSFSHFDPYVWVRELIPSDSVSMSTGIRLVYKNPS